MTLKIGDKAPNFKLKTDGSGEISLSKLKGQKILLYFYPKDDTPGCTKQACGFRDLKADFEKHGTTIIGVSKDTPEKHDKFKKKHDLNFTLASDDQEICETYGVWVEKNMYGKKYMGIERTSFLIDEKGKIIDIWRKVKVKDHIDTVLERLKTA